MLMEVELKAETATRVGGPLGTAKERKLQGKMLVPTVVVVQSFYHKKGVNLGLIAREGFSNVSYMKKCALQHTKSLKESDWGKTLKSHLNVVNFG